MADLTLTMPEHHDGGLVADPWERTTVRARVHPAPRMTYAEIQARAAGWPERRAALARIRGLAAEGRLERDGQVGMFGRAGR